MAFLFVDSLAENNSRFVQISGKILELVLLSVGLISTVVVMKEAVLPYSCEIVFSSLMGFWSSIRCFLSSPLTIVITINLMVLLIFASSALYGRRDDDDQHQETTSTLLDVDDLHVQIAHDESPIAPPPQPQPSAPPIWDVVEFTPPPLNVEETPPPPSIPTSTTLHRAGTSWYHSTQALDPSPKTSALVPQPHEIEKTIPLEKWKDVFIEKVEGKATNIHQESEEEEDEDDNTMDATWEAIVGGGKPKPKKKPLKKSETWEARAPPRRLDSEEVVPTSPKWKELRKAETFNDAVSVTRRGGLIRRDPSMSLEEFNQKVERFIKNFNDGIRLQRQESYRRFLDIINQKRA